MTTMFTDTMTWDFGNYPAMCMVRKANGVIYLPRWNAALNASYPEQGELLRLNGVAYVVLGTSRLVVGEKLYVAVVDSIKVEDIDTMNVEELLEVIHITLTTGSSMTRANYAMSIIARRLSIESLSEVIAHHAQGVQGHMLFNSVELATRITQGYRG